MTDTDRRMHRAGLLTRATGGLLVAEAVVLAVVVGVRGHHVPRPVTAHLGGERVTIAHVDVAVAGIVVVALVGVLRLVLGSTALERWLEVGLPGPIAVFLVAQLNGIDDIAALVVIYALISAAILFTIVAELQGTGKPRLPVGFSAAVGIVPWGAIAFQQVGSIVIGRPLPPVVVVITLTMLAYAVVAFVPKWFDAARARRTVLTEQTVVVVGVLAPSLFAWLVLAL